MRVNWNSQCFGKRPTRLVLLLINDLLLMQHVCYSRLGAVIDY